VPELTKDVKSEVKADIVETQDAKADDAEVKPWKGKQKQKTYRE
jgi:hypothetical protein